ncbi:hypothetical protein PC110_g19239 [Phytophthora cactorum]|uniref:DDE-1 domain-containing protein n=1 Tax=Phytophthora cactorum TaxID=29920 RepID=A0A329RI76_9STRA|nr:hypothetical protein PC110_g19239 [Phytophthora cactorum]
MKPSKIAAKDNETKRCGFSTKTWPEIKQIQRETGLQIYTNGKGWWMGGLSVQFLRFNFANRSPTEEPVLLLWDDFSGHWSAEVLLYAPSINVVLLKVPPHVTPVCQLADVAWNHLQEQVWGPRKQGKKFKLVPPGRSGICNWILASWEGLSTETIANGYKKCNWHLDKECLAVASLISELQKLSTAENTSSAVDDDQEFDRIVEEAVV